MSGNPSLRDIQNLITTVVGLQGNPIFAGSPNVGDGLVWDGGNWRGYPTGMSGPFLPLAGGTVTGNVEIDARLIAGPSADAGGNSVIDLTGGSAIIEASGNSLLMQQTGDDLGGTALMLGNRTGLNGALFTNQSLDLVDFAFQAAPSGAIGSLRFEARGIPNGSFQLMLAGAPVFILSSTGQLTLAGTLIRPGVTDGSNAAAGMVGEYMQNDSGSAGIASATWTSTAVLTLTPGDWECEGTVSYSPTIANNAGMYAGFSPTINGSPTTYNSVTGAGGFGGMSLPAPRTRFNVTSNTTIYLNGFIYLGDGTTCDVGGTMNARRVR